MVRLTERDLHNIVKKVLAEVNFNRPNNGRMIYQQRREKLANLGIPMEVLERLSNRLVDELLEELL